MRFSLLLALPLLCRAQASSPAQNSTQISQLTSLAQFLSGAGETAFVNATESVAGSQGGNQFLAELVDAVTGNRSLTTLVPNDNAFTGSPPKNITDPNTLAAIFSYHLIEGQITTNNIASFPNYTLVRTFLNNSQLVQLEGNESQVLAITNDNGTIKVLGQNTPVQFVSAITLPSNFTNKNLKAYVLSAVLDPPPPLADVLSSANLSAFQSQAQQTSYLDALESTHGVTIFAPSNEAAAVLTQGNNTNLNVTTVTALLGNHVINGTTVYSTQFPLNATSASGEPFSIITNSSGAFVSSGSSTAKIIQPDILISNGVLHVIDHVLVNEATNSSAASSAVASASSAAATAASAQATQTSPVGNSSPSGVGSSGSSSSGSNSSGSGGKNNTSDAISNRMSSGYVTSIFLSVIAGCVIV